VLEVATVTATNTISDLAKTPIANTVVMLVNGQSIPEVASYLTVTGKSISFDNTVAGYDIETTDKVRFSYETLD
jgi:S-adenosylmethionine synthetase